MTREEVKNRIRIAIDRAFSERKTINMQLATGLNEMVDALFDAFEPKFHKENEEHEQRSPTRRKESAK